MFLIWISMKSIIHVEDFKSENTEENGSGVLVKRKGVKAIHTYYKGAQETKGYKFNKTALS